MLRNTECEQLQTHVNAYLDNKIDVHFLLDETDKKVELETENSRLSDELSKVTLSTSSLSKFFFYVTLTATFFILLASLFNLFKFLKIYFLGNLLRFCRIGGFLIFWQNFPAFREFVLDQGKIAISGSRLYSSFGTT